MSPIVVAVLAALNLIAIFLVLAAPLGRRAVVRRFRVGAAPERLWSALWPLGDRSGWSGEILSAEAAGDGRAKVRLSWEGRDGRPIEKLLRLTEVETGRRFVTRVEDDSSLDPAFWADYREEISIEPDGAGSIVVWRQTDRYRGLAFLVFRYFALRRKEVRLREWAATGASTRRFLFERPLTQVGFALLSVLILWPFFGLNLGGLVLAAILTLAVALHELGHMAAFRLMGHRTVRMIFIPLLGGIAVGGRPYDSRFEVAFVALMGAGFSAFVVPIAMASSSYAHASHLPALSAVLATFAGVAAFFNIANLVPVWKFDGGQVLRQLFPHPFGLALISFSTLSAFLLLGSLTGLSNALLVMMGVVFAVLSLITSGSGVKPRHALKPVSSAERVGLASAFVAVFAIHFCGVLWAYDRFA